MPATPFMPPAVVGAPVPNVCEANVTGALVAAGTPAPPAQLGGTDSGPIEDPAPAEASTGAAPIAPPPTPAAGATLPASAEPRPPMSAPSVDGPLSAVSRPPPPRPMRSEPADAQLPTWMLPKLMMLLFRIEPDSALFRPLIRPVKPVIASAGFAAAPEALCEA